MNILAAIKREERNLINNCFTFSTSMKPSVSHEWQ